MDWKKHEKKLLQNPKFRQAAAKIEPEYQLARSIILIRLKRGLTQKQLARKMRTSQSAIARVESGYYLPSLSFLKRLSQALERPLNICLS
ncbi:hypothetical protein A2160_04625 [Candidatus Beckwithbacteria bacterium RBG_13_42_9]|uniref:HTH cro/C1-type domain-containing protein n=1 Tax=Candidatus Beckwithbacteria bacterium RBG_13_42_9 TaxID=1797457 RepID=A0A1F5E3T7_9BACT|nr:MAG: hypothetical protein A2160_04625 [Candidatus Beckwithbacteria bacterium RBG_13_42_9]